MRSGFPDAVLTALGKELSSSQAKKNLWLPKRNSQGEETSETSAWS